MSALWVYIVGFIAQGLFFVRFLVQWVMSERAGRVLSPAIFWQLSLLASFLLFVYGWLRDDFSILLGQLFAYYIYVWNLRVQGKWVLFPRLMRWLFMVLPVVATAWLVADWSNTSARLFHNADVPFWLLLWGSAGQTIFALRFIYQWLYSRRKGESVLPAGFWLISLVGASIIVSYAVYRLDPVLLVGQATGLFVYSRNLFLWYKSNPPTKAD